MNRDNKPIPKHQRIDGRPAELMFPDGTHGEFRGSLMVQFNQPTPLGVPLYTHELETAIVELRHDDRLACVTPEALGQMMHQFLRDLGLQYASGRWNPGQTDPARFVPGDIAAVRVTAMGGYFWDAVSVAVDTQGRPHGLALDAGPLLANPLETSVLVEATTAAPYFLSLPATMALLATHPPMAALVNDLRLPASRVMVLFGADLRIDPAVHSWPRDLRLPPGDDGLVPGMLTRGGYVSGIVLLADDTRRLRDDCIWILAAAPDPSRPYPHSLDRLRGYLRGWRSMAGLAPLIEATAAAVVGGRWRSPIAPGETRWTVDARTAWDAAKQDQNFRRQEQAGAIDDVQVLDLAATIAEAGTPSAVAPRTGIFRRTHARRPHPDLQWVPSRHQSRLAEAPHEVILGALLDARDDRSPQDRASPPADRPGTDLQTPPRPPRTQEPPPLPSQGDPATPEYPDDHGLDPP